MENFISVDPGVNTGYAFFENEELSVHGCFKIKKLKGITKDKHDQLKELWNHFIPLVEALKPEIVYIECVELWEASVKSKTSAVRGDLFKLSYLIGGYCRICHERNISFVLVSPLWKGQLSKDALKSRVEKMLGITFTNQHTVDAVGLGLNRLGKI